MAEPSGEIVHIVQYAYNTVLYLCIIYHNNHKNTPKVVGKSVFYNLVDRIVSNMTFLRFIENLYII